jgi:drug/metabolite transporter (DMT)-like permease
VSAAAGADVLAAPTDASTDRLALGAFTGTVLIGGSNFVAIRFSNRELEPLWGAGFRFALAAGVFGLLVAALGLSFPRGRALALVVAYGLLAFGGAYGCLYWAMLMPVVAVVVGALLADEAIAATTVAGGAIVAVGVYAGAMRRG